MTKGILKASLLISAMIGVFTYIFLQTRTIDVTEHNLVMLRIQDLIYQDALINESIMQSSAGRFSNYDAQTRYKKNVKNHLDWLESRKFGLNSEYGRNIRNAIKNTARDFDSKMELTDQFKEKMGQFKFSLFYLPAAIKRNERNPDKVMYQADLNDLLKEVLLFNSRPNNKNKANALQLIEKFTKIEDSQLSQLAMHAEIVINERLALLGYINELYLIPTKKGIDDIYRTYSQHSNMMLAQASLYRTAMYAMALVLLFYVAYLFWANRKAMLCLKESLSEIAFQKLALDEHTIVVVMDADGTISYVNEKFNHISQFSNDEIVGSDLSEIGTGDNPLPFFTRVKGILTNGKSWKGETLSHKKDGSHYWVDATIVPFLDETSQPLKYVALLTDITARKNAEAEQKIVQDELRLAASVFSESPMGIIIADSTGSVLRVNSAFQSITGFSSQDVSGQRIQIFRSELHEKEFYKKIWMALANTGHWEGEVWNHRKDGSTYPVWSNISTVKNSQGETSYYINSFSDISERKKTEDRIFYLAHYDALTDLPNRAFFLERVEKAIAKVSDERGKIAILFLDLDNFKMVNDTLGHARGDLLLKSVAEKLLSCVRESDIVARLGGDEFVIALVDVQSVHSVENLSQRILDLTRETFNHEGKNIFVSSSIGISMLPDDASDIELLIKNADTAMYGAKSNGKSMYQFFHETMNNAASTRHDIGNDLRLAINNHQFSLHYQPQVFANTGEVYAVEALLRWDHPVHGSILPDTFIHELEDSGLIIEVGKWVLQEALSQLAVWKNSGFSIRMAVNISSAQLEHDHLPTFIQELLVSESVKPHELELELTESCLMENLDYSISILQKLSDIGVSLALDNFGTGYSSLSCLKRVPIDTLKIDQSFVQDISKDKNDNAILTTVIAMGESLGLQVVGKGVETAEQYAFLLQRDCDYIQGNYVGEPVSADKLESLLRDSRQLVKQVATARST